MAFSPLPVLFVILTASTLSSLIAGGDTIDFGVTGDEVEEPGGFFDALIGVVKAVFGVVGLILKGLLWDIPGLPGPLRVILLSMTGLSLIWSVATLVRGT